MISTIWTRWPWYLNLWAKTPEIPRGKTAISNWCQPGEPQKETLTGVLFILPGSPGCVFSKSTAYLWFILKLYPEWNLLQTKEFPCNNNKCWWSISEEAFWKVVFTVHSLVLLLFNKSLIRTWCAPNTPMHRRGAEMVGKLPCFKGAQSWDNVKL